ncbi:MAG: hypothetical protein ACK5N7_12195 [Curvibacter sp.]|jgi:hypothetical protein
MTGQPPRWYQIAGLALAGLSSFFLAAYWSSASDNETDEIVQPVIRSLARPAPAAPSASAQASEAPELPAKPPLQLSARTEHATSQVAHNPFGSLNLLAGAELDSGKNSGVPFRSPVKAPARKPKVEQQPAPAVVADAPPPPLPAPTAPPLPFSVVGGISGKQIAGGEPVAFLKMGADVIVVRPGEQVSDMYRVESIASDQIEFTYLPLNQRQALPMRP